MARATFKDHRRLLRGFNQFTQMVRCDCINGYGVGKKVRDGKTVDELSIVVFVNKKLSLRRLPLSNRIPKVIRIPDDRASGGVLEFITDVREARFSSLEFTAKERPAPSGISIGHVHITAGTLGGLVKDNVTGKTVILSNNHVLANANDASLGDAILQPGPYDGGTTAADQIATLTRFVPIDFSQGAENRVDAAIATPRNPGDVVWSTKQIGDRTPAVARALSEDDLGLFVQKTGRTTEHTQGFVQALFATVQVKYDLFQKATFVDQIICSQSPAEEEFSSGGDSGSLVYDSKNQVVGLLFAGSEGSDTEPATTILNPINFVLTQLDVDLLGAGMVRPPRRPAKGTGRRTRRTRRR